VDDNQNGQGTESTEDWPDLESATSPKSKALVKSKQPLRSNKVNPSNNITQLDTKVSVKHDSTAGTDDDEEIDQLLESLEDGEKETLPKNKSKSKASNSDGSWENES